jgi:hypothetical protein
MRSLEGDGRPEGRSERDRESVTARLKARKKLAVSTGSDAGFHFANGAIDCLNCALAMSAFIVLRSFQSAFRFAQMRKRSSHVGLIRPN